MAAFHAAGVDTPAAGGSLPGGPRWRRTEQVDGQVDAVLEGRDDSGTSRKAVDVLGLLSVSFQDLEVSERRTKEEAKKLAEYIRDVLNANWVKEQLGG